MRLILWPASLEFQAFRKDLILGGGRIGGVKGQSLIFGCMPVPPSSNIRRSGSATIAHDHNPASTKDK